MIAAGGTAEERLLVLASLASPTVDERAELAALTAGRVVVGNNGVVPPM